jgi:hypothetical protein
VGSRAKVPKGRLKDSGSVGTGQWLKAHVDSYESSVKYRDQGAFSTRHLAVAGKLIAQSLND